MRHESPLRMPLSHAERFFPTKNNKGEQFAALTFGAPANLTTIEYWMFKKTPHERHILKEMKKELGKTKHHKFETMFIGSF